MTKTEKTIFITFSAILGSILVFTFCYVAYFWIKYPLNYRDSITLRSKQFNLEPELVASVINAESGFDKGAVSSKGAVGLMQLMPKTAVFVGDMLGENVDTKSLTQSDTNIKLGCCYLEYLKEKFEDEKVVLASYNAGEGVVSRWLADKRFSPDGKTLTEIPYKETREYIKKVQQGKSIYKNRLK